MSSPTDSNGQLMKSWLPPIWYEEARSVDALLESEGQGLTQFKADTGLVADARLPQTAPDWGVDRLESEMGLTAGVAASQVNLVQNPSFEVNTSLWVTNGGATITRMAGPGAVAGSDFIARAVYTVAGQWVGYQLGAIPVAGNTTYAASIYMRGTAGQFAALRWWDNITAEVSVPGGENIALSGTWQQVIITRATGVGATGAGIIIRAVGASQTIDLDEFRFELVIPGMSIESRRSRILARFRGIGTTIYRLKQIAATWGYGEVAILPGVEDWTLYMQFTDLIGVPADVAAHQVEIAHNVEAHLNVVWSFYFTTWGEVRLQGSQYQDFQSVSMPWDTVRVTPYASLPT